MDIIKKIFRFGVDDKFPEYLNRKIILTNQIAFILFFVTMIFVFLSYFLFYEVFFIAVFAAAMFFTAITANYFGLINLSRFIIAINSVTSTVIFHAFITQEGEIGHLGLFSSVISSMILPFFVFDLREKKYLFSSFGFIYILALLHRPLSHYFDVAMDDSIWYDANFERFMISIALNTIFIGMLFQQHLRIKAENKNEIYTKRIKEQNDDISEQISQIQNSIKYALTIQKTFLGNPENIIKNFYDGFIMYIPRDIVSGDFYWHSEFQGKKIVVASDCTGHGVPGAMLTVMGLNYLNQIVKTDHITEPDKILFELDKRVNSVTLSKNREDVIQDGMDISVLMIDTGNQIAKFAGSKSPILYSEGEKLIKIKGSHSPIGSTHYGGEKKFEKHEIPIESGMNFYLYSDGFQDQFGGEKNRKYMSGHFKDLLEKNMFLPMVDQKVLLYREFEKWKNGKPQTDDLMIIGLRI